MRAYSVKTLAGMLDCSPRHVYDLIESGQIRAFRLGKRALRVTEGELQRWLEDGQTQSTESASAGATAKPLPISAMKIISGGA